MQKPNITPTTKTERIAYLDILRGISILFIYTANILFFSGIMFLPEDTPLRIYTLPTDELMRFLNYVLVDGKFYSLFSMLFGIGCVIQYNNLISHNKAFAPFFRKRMFWLLIFGLVHLVLFWAGDILTLYAILGFLLIYLIKKSNKTLLVSAVVLILLPLVNWAFINYSGFFYPGLSFLVSTEIYQYFDMPVVEVNGNFRPDISAYLLNDSVLNFFKMNIGNTFVRIGRILEEGRAFKVFGIFLIGIWAGRKIINENLLDNSRFLKKVLIVGLLFGLPFNILRGYLQFYAETSDTLYFLKTLSYALGTVPLALGYAAGIALLAKNGVSFLNWFKPVGKTALSNYLFQTGISIIIFYGFGFKLGGKFGFTYIMLIGLGVFITQIIMSKVWLNYFRYGPMEWLWRMLTYGTSVRIRINKKS